MVVQCRAGAVRVRVENTVRPGRRRSPASDWICVDLTRIGLPARTKFVVWLACVTGAFVLTHTPAPDDFAIPPWLGDKLLHLVGYLVLGWVTTWMINRGPPAVPRRVTVGCLIGLMVYAVFDEATQPLVGRSCEVSDWIADALGACLGTVGCLTWRRRLAAADRQGPGREGS